MNDKVSKEKKIKELLESRKKVKKRLKKVREQMKEEKDIEEVWPGHESVRYHQTEMERDVLLAHLAGIEKELKELKKKK
jgi:allophanate hydrolase subunit 1